MPRPNLKAHLKSVRCEVTRSPQTSWLSGPLLAQRWQPRFLAPPSPSPSCCCSIHQIGGLSTGQVYVEGSQKESGRASLPVCRWRAPESGDDRERGVFAPRGGKKIEEMFRHLLTEPEVKPKIQKDWFHRHVFSTVRVSVIIRTITQRQQMPRSHVLLSEIPVAILTTYSKACLLFYYTDLQQLIHKLTFPIPSL